MFKERLQCSDAVRTLDLRAMVGIGGRRQVGGNGIENTQLMAQPLLGH